jgi:hypothetical protein
MPFHEQVSLAVIAVHNDPKVIVLLMDLEMGMILHSGKQAATQNGVQPGGRVSSGDEYSFSVLAVLFPFHGDSMGSTLGRKAKEGRQESWPQVLEANQADADHSLSIDLFWPEGMWQYLG